MATLQALLPKNTYKQLLQIGSLNSGLSASIQYVQGGDGTSSVLGLSTTGVSINATKITINGFDITPGANITTVGAVSIGSILTTAGAITFSGTSGFTATITGTTAVTFPTSGTLLSTAAVVTLIQGGTGNALTASDGGIFYSNSNGGVILAGTPTAGKLLASGASTAPIWTTPTYPTTSGSSGKILLSDGTNNVYSTPTFPNASATSGKKIQSDGTNWVASTSTWPTSGTQGGIVYSDASNSFSQLAKDTNSTRVLCNTGTNNAPQWNQVALTTGVSGILPLANGGSGFANSQQLVQRVSTTSIGTSGTTRIPQDNTAPQNTEGTQIASLSITPKNASNKLVIRLLTTLGNSAIDNVTLALFQDSTASALAVSDATIALTNNQNPGVLNFEMVAGTTSSTTFNIRIGNASGTWVVGNVGIAVTYAGLRSSIFEILEYTP